MLRRALLVGAVSLAVAMPAFGAVHKGARGPGHLSRVQKATAAPPPPPPPAAQFFFPTGTDLILAAATL